MTYLKHCLFAAVMVMAAMAMSVKPAYVQPCEQDRFEENTYIVCTVDVAKADLRLFWKDSGGRPYRIFPRVAGAVSGEGKTLLFALNAGMYLPDFAPIGLYVENGSELRPVAPTELLKAPKGPVPNFYKTPNGIFFATKDSAEILPTEQFLKLKPDVLYATQSGPMLVTKNQLNPIFIVGSKDRTQRSGVGTCKDNLVRFAISDGTVNFHDFGRLFRDHLKCEDALFLDGGEGVGFYNPSMNRNDISWHGGYGPIFGLVE